MRILFRPSAGEQGTALMVTMFLCTILFMTVVGYLLNARHQEFIGRRAQIWNMSMSVAEAGVEEALQHLNANSPDLEKEGWTRDGTTYQRAQTLTADSHYVVSINAFDIDDPIITSIGYMDAPVFTRFVQGGAIAAVGSTSFETSIEIAKTIGRTLEVKASRDRGPFLGSLIARDSVDLNGNNILTDSFISSDPGFSDNGLYPAGDSSKLRSNGDVYVNSSLVGAADVGNADIYGRLVVGPNGVPNLGPSGGVGTYAWRLAGNDGIQDGYLRDDANYTFPEIELPYTFGATPTSGTVTTTNISISTETTNTVTYPDPPPTTGVVTNITYATTSVPPDPEPDGMVVNPLTTRTQSNSYPEPGTFVGDVSKIGSLYHYDLITGYSYTYPIYSYTYDTYATNYSTTTATYDYILQGGDPALSPVDYYVDQINGSVFVRGNVRLVARDGFAGDIVIGSDGRLEMFTGGDSITLSGNGVLNETGYAANCIIWCMPSVQTITLSGNTEVTAVLYAANADLHLDGGGNNGFDFIGSLVVKSASLNGHFQFHFDEALLSLNSNARYLITSWREI